jgi:proteasome assembly chaperone (PAC2) family protein
MNGLIKLKARPKLNSPNILAAWPGVGNVSMIVASYLLRKLDFKELGEIDPSYFFDPVGVVVKDNVVEEPKFPQSKFYYLKTAGKGSDLIVFIGEDQPAAKGYELAKCVLDIADKFEAVRIITCAAAMTRIHHTESPGVLGVATSQPAAAIFKKYNLIHAGNLQIAGLNGLLLGVAKERDIDGICLLGEVPVYATRIQNPMAALSVLEVLTTMLGVEVDLDELAQLAVETKQRMKQVASQAMGEYIDYFTEPIWESGEEEEDEEG